MTRDPLADAFATLAASGRAAADGWPADEAPETYGLERQGDWVVPAGRFDPLRDADLRAALSHRARGWLRDLEILPVIGSTNARLLELAEGTPVAGRICTAEVQVQGRGRRGRSWASPFGANLAISLGMASSLPPAELGGVSLVVGLGVLDALERLDVPGLALKWPNDVLLDGDKLGGILIELTQRRGTELVIGIGLNVALPPAVRRELPAGVTDLAGRGVERSRSALAGAVVSAVVEFVGEFERLGFEPFRAPFDARHAYHGRACHVLQGERRIVGRVAGVSAQGELQMETAEGLQSFNGGEVSLRQAP